MPGKNGKDFRFEQSYIIPQKELKLGPQPASAPASKKNKIAPAPEKKNASSTHIPAVAPTRAVGTTLG